MREHYLEVTYRKGKPIAAYLYLSRRSGLKSLKTKEVFPGLLIDFGPNEVPIGLEITAPRAVRLADITNVLKQLGCITVHVEDLAPLHLAA